MRLEGHVVRHPELLRAGDEPLGRAVGHRDRGGDVHRIENLVEPAVDAVLLGDDDRARTRRLLVAYEQMRRMIIIRQSAI